MPPQKKKALPVPASSAVMMPRPAPIPAASSNTVAVESIAATEQIAPASASDIKEPSRGGEAVSFDVPNAIYELLAGNVAAELNAASSSMCDSGPGSGSRLMSQEDYVTVIVTPKLTFQLLKRPEWETVQDITQSELRRGFLSRFPPALWLSSEKFSFRAALPPTHRLTEETNTLFFKLVSDEVPDERVLLGILRELEKSYEAIIRRAVTETRSEALQEQFMLQEQAEEFRREQEKIIKDLRKDVKSFKEQNQSIQKRLFLVEQEKDQLQREQHQTKEHLQRLEKQHAEHYKDSRREQEDMRAQMETLQAFVAGSMQKSSLASGDPAAGKSAIVESDVADRCDRSEIPKRDSCTVEVGAQTEKGIPVKRSELVDVSSRVDQLQQQLGALQGWMLQGSQLLNVGGSRST